MKTWTFAALLAGLVATVGCGGKTGESGDGHAHADHKHPHGKKAEPKDEGGHHGWWCDEHGVREEECSMCDPKVAKAFQDKGDWCKLHDRAKSQCFICDPGLKDKYAAEYRARYGKEPPEPKENMPEKKDEKK